MERLDPIKHAKESGLVDDQPAQGCLTIWLIPDRQPVKSVGPAIREMASDPDLINTRLVHRETY
jgi:hypothetical protein